MTAPMSRPARKSPRPQPETGQSEAITPRDRVRTPPSQVARLLTRTELAAELGKNPVTITKWQGEGLPVAVRGGRGRESKYRIADVWEWGLARERARAGGSGAAEMNLPVERAKLSRIQTQLAQQKFRKAEGELLEAHEIGRTWSLIVLAIKSKLLALVTTVADRLVGAVRGAETEEGARSAVMTILAAEVRDVLRELAGFKIEDAKVDEPTDKEAVAV